MPESLRSRWNRYLWNLFPAYRGTGGRIRYLSSDQREMRIELPLSWRTRNYVGTIYGGSMYGCLDPVMMVLLIRALGPEYVVWDKAATIRFLKPGRTTLHCRIALEDSELEGIRTALRTERSVDRVYLLELSDAKGVVHAQVEKTVYVRRKDAARAARSPTG